MNGETIYRVATFNDYEAWDWKYDSDHISLVSGIKRYNELKDKGEVARLVRITKVCVQSTRPNPEMMLQFYSSVARLWMEDCFRDCREMLHDIMYSDLLPRDSELVSFGHVSFLRYFNEGKSVASSGFISKLLERITELEEELQNNSGEAQ